jgi:hypothetical protein
LDFGLKVGRPPESGKIFFIGIKEMKDKREISKEKGRVIS